MSEKEKDLKNNDEDLKNNDEISKVLLDMDTYKYCKTDILHNIKFENKMDEFVFNSLPLTNSQKEQLLIELYKC